MKAFVFFLRCPPMIRVIFWASSCPEGFVGGPYFYSLVYNGGYMLPNIIINGIVLCIIAIKAPKLFEPNDTKGEEA